MKNRIMATAVMPVRKRKLVSMNNAPVRYPSRIIVISEPKAPIKKKE